MTIEKKITTFRGHDGLNLYAQWHLVSQAKGIIVLKHGYGEHCGRYTHVISHLNEAGYSVYTYDCRGHGRSPGQPGYIDKFDKLVADFAVFVQFVHERAANTPMYLMGHSCGGQIVAHYAAMQGMTHHEKGLILSAVAVDFWVPRWKFAIFNYLVRFFPKLKTAPPVIVTLLSHDPAMNKATQDDPYFYRGRVTARTAYEIVCGGQKAIAGSHLIHTPILILCGAADQIANPLGSKLIFDQVSSTDKTTKTYEGFYHEIMNESGRNQVLEDITTWLKKFER